MKSLGETRIHTPQTEALNMRGALTSEYIEVNHNLLKRAFPNLPNQFVWVDVASGTGLVSQELAKLCAVHHKLGRVIGVEPDHYAVGRAREETPSSPVCITEFIEGYGQDLKLLVADRMPEKGADGASIHDALHEVESQEEKEAVLNAIASILGPGKIFTFNSAFTSVANTLAAGKWRRDVLVTAGLEWRTKSQLEVLSPEQYKQMIEKAGIAVVYEQRITIPLPRKFLDGMSIYPRFIKGMFDGVPDEERYSLEEKSEMLKASLERRNIQRIDRIWYEVMGVKAA